MFGLFNSAQTSLGEFQVSGKMNFPKELEPRAQKRKITKYDKRFSNSYEIQD